MQNVRVDILCDLSISREQQVWARSFNTTTSDYKSSILHSLHLVHLVQTKTLLFILPSYLLSFGHKLKCEFKKENKTIHYYSREGHDSLSINFGIKCNMTVGENIFLITSETIHYQKYWNIFYKYTQFAFLVIISVWEIESNTGYWMLQYSSISAIWFIWAQPPVASANGDTSLSVLIFAASIHKFSWRALF